MAILLSEFIILGFNILKCEGEVGDPGLVAVNENTYFIQYKYHNLVEAPAQITSIVFRKCHVLLSYWLCDP